ncbi:hypothetical protein C3F09_03300 [candidate division GN15 bacterium]|uniref:Major facilitator superfamily (MFS) profile domain-containing protein n=1 Tax=candidate division GN15 bacterium TaxID=2072418 RepID=A0A855XA47_9BACT|nr:MAG: hypothetical protein C3F09_03300 [candidate division GN15 bacterium]
MTSTSVWRRDVVAWSLYDLANTIYSMNIVSLYLKRYIVQDLGKPDHYFDIAFSLSMALTALVLPALGAMSDHTTKKKLFLLLFTLTCCIPVGLLAAVPPSMVFVLLLLFIIANFSYEAGMPFYNALLYSVSDGMQARFVSGIGVAIGYIGSIVGMLLVLPFVSGSIMDIRVPFIAGSGKSGAFLPTAVLFLLFAIPTFIWVKEKRVHRPQRATIRQAYREVWDGLRNTRRFPGVLRYLIADYFFEDAVATVILNIGLYCSIVLQLPENQISMFLILSTISAVVGSFIIGKIAEHWSLKNLLTIIMWGWVVSLVTFAITDNMAVIWVLGSVVGILLGGLWTTSRPLLAELVPREDLGRFFGLFALSGRAAAIVGPLVWTSVVLLTRPGSSANRWFGSNLPLISSSEVQLPYKLAVLSLAVMILIGLLIFRKVPHTRTVRHE